jgi:hypothetical protein
MVASLRYLDTFGFAERRLYVDWLEERAPVMTANPVASTYAVMAEVDRIDQRHRLAA